MVTARFDLHVFTRQCPYEQQYLRPDRAPVLVGVTRSTMVERLTFDKW